MPGTRPATFSSFRRSIKRLRAPLALALALGACTPVAARYDAAARAAGLERREVEGAGFRHAVFVRPGGPSGGVLRLYIEGDGTPLFGHGRPTADPTPRRPAMPALLALDPGPAALLGRPCHHGLATTTPCRPEHWTAARYAAAIVDSMAAAARRLAAEGGRSGLALVGHSGGGVLALLMAERLPEVRAVVAVAAVVDIDLWSRWHGLAPLHGSLNPRRAAPGDAGRPELFLAGADDRVAPPALVAEAIAGRPAARLSVLPGVAHACCWAEAWPGVLAWLAANGR